MRPFLLLLAIGLCGGSALGQCGTCAIGDTCTVTPPYPTVCPLLPPPGIVGVPMELDVTFWIPPEFQEAGTGLTVIVEQITVTSISGVPLGLTFEANDPDLVYYPAVNPFGCVRVCGTPMVPGQDTVVVNATAVATVAGIPVNQAQTLRIPLTIIMSDEPNIGFAFAPDSACAPLTVAFDPLISGPGLTSTYDWDFGNGNTHTGDTPPAQTYDAGEHIVTLQTTVTTPMLTQAALTAVNENWCGDIDEPNLPFIGCVGQPDIYFVLSDGNNGSQRSSTVANDESPSWSGLNMALNFPPYTLRFFDADDLSADDLLGTFAIPAGTGTFPFSLSGTTGSVQVQIQTVQIFEDIDTVIVFPAPDVDISFNPDDNTLCIADQGFAVYEWQLDGTVVPGLLGPCIEASNGVWTVSVTNAFGCSDSDSYTVIDLGVGDGGPTTPAVSIYPVPNQGRFTVRAYGLRNDGDWRLRVLDMAGRSVFEERVLVTGSLLVHAMDLSGTAPGAYLLHLSDGTGTYVRPFIVGPSH